MASAYYIERARRPKNCWDCDGLRACRCGKVTIRAVKRSARAAWKERIREEAWEPSLDYFREMADLAFAVRGLFREA
jgi:hypothetical protein